MFLLLFFSPPVSPRRSDDRRQNTSSREMSEASGWMVTKVWKKGVFCWRVLEHDRRSELMDQNQPRRMPRLIILDKVWQQWCVSCDWVTCVCDTDSPHDIRWWRLVIISLCFSLPPFWLSLCLPSFLETWQKLFERLGNFEAVKLNPEDQMVCVRDLRKIVLEKT